MKKIIATVLAMVMAMALCSTAFAATDTWVIYKVAEDGTATAFAGITGATYPNAITKTDAKDSGTTKNVEYWTYGDTDWVACDKDDAETSDGSYYVMCKNGKTYDKGSFYAYVKTTTVVEYSKTVTEQDETTDKASCTKNHYLEDGYLDDDGDFYVKDNTGVASITAKVSGTQKLVTLYKVSDSSNEYVIYASHILGEAVKNSDKGYYEATCLVCGAKVALTSDLDVLKKNSIKVVDTYTYDADEAEAVADDNGNEGAYAFAVGTKFAGDYTYAWDLTSGSSSSTTTDKTSPKTFDAGVAMYVGMALASVTGSAVVIGKKKEF